MRQNHKLHFYFSKIVVQLVQTLFGLNVSWFVIESVLNAVLACDGVCPEGCPDL